MKRFTIQKRIFLYIVLLVSFLLSSIMVSNYTVFFEFLKKNEVESAISATQKTKQNIEVIFKIANDMSAALSEKSDILGEMKRGDLTQPTKVEKIEDMLSQLVELQVYFNGIYIMGYNGTFISSNSKYKEDPISRYDQLPEFLREKVTTLFSNIDRKTHYIVDSADGKIYYLYLIQDNLTGQDLGVIMIDINNTYLREVFSAASFKKIEKVMVVNKNGDILFSFPYNVYLGEVIEQNPKLLEMQTTQISSKVFKKDSIIVSDTIDYSDWKLIRIINTDKVFRSVNDLSKYTIYIFIFFVVVALIASLLISVSFTKPIIELNNRIKKVEKGDLSVAFTTERKDELGELSSAFNKMVVQVKNLINDKMEQQKKKSDMEFQVLQAQINPHFLYNTLNSIKWLAVIQNIENISEMTSAIINLLKYNISSKSILVTLEEEIDSIKNYVNIQKYRYGSNFNIEYNIDEDTVKLKILKFILQPLVENSIFHGFKNYKYGGEIRISSQIADNNLLIEVRDNGCGLNKGESDSTDDKSKRMHSGIGLNNVHERISLYFGGEYGITVNSQEGPGLSITIKLPVITNDYRNENINGI